MYVLYRSRHVLGWLPAALATVLIAWTLQRVPLKIQPTYDESSVQLALAEPEPAMAALTAEPVLPEPPPPPPPTTVEPEPETPQVVAEEPVAPPPPKPRVEQRPKAAPRPQQTAPSAAPAAAAKVAEVTPRPATVPSPAAPTPPRPSVNAAALEGGYLQGVRSDLERFKQYPTGRQAALERPSGKVVIWLLVDRSGKVLDRGVEERASSMLLNRAATMSLARIEHVKPFPPEAFAGRSQMRITATFDYSPH